MVALLVLSVLACSLAGLGMFAGIWLAMRMLGPAPYDLGISITRGVTVLPHERPEKVLGRHERAALRKLRRRIERGELEE